MLFHAVTIMAFGSLASAHIEMSNPAPFRSKFNKNVPAEKKDYNGLSPLSGAAQFPCKGFLGDLADSSGLGASVATYKQGQSAAVTLDGSAVHGGGSCQVALSYGDHKKYTVIHSYQGGCPAVGVSLPFTIPADAPTGPAVFAWTWVNKIGNREFYMNCASVTIEAGSGSAPTIPFASRPDIFVAALGNGCNTIEGQEVVFPNPGPDITGKSGAASGFTGACAPINGIGNAANGAAQPPPVGSSQAASPAASQASTPTSKAVPPPTSASSSLNLGPIGGTVTVTTKVPAPTSSKAMVTVTVTVTENGSEGQIKTTSAASVDLPTASPGVQVSAGSSAASASTVSPSLTASGSAPNAEPTGSATDASSTGGISTDGSCAGKKGHKCSAGHCCSSAGFCGNSAAHCGAGCQADFGQCGTLSRARRAMIEA